MYYNIFFNTTIVSAPVNTFLRIGKAEQKPFFQHATNKFVCNAFFPQNKFSLQRQSTSLLLNCRLYKKKESQNKRLFSTI